MERALVRGSIRLALSWDVQSNSAGAAGADPVEAILRVSGGRLLFRGTIVDVERRFRAGHDWGTLRIDGVDADRGQRAEIAFKNEYLILRVDEQVVLTVPDLITLVETDSGTPVTTEVVRTGLRVSVLGLRSSPLYHTPEALRVSGRAPSATICRSCRSTRRRSRSRRRSSSADAGASSAPLPLCEIASSSGPSAGCRAT